MKNKKSQVSVFLILGIVLIIAAASVFYITTRETREEIAPGVYITTQEIPTELHPVNDFVAQCLEETTTSGLKLVGQHGGYVSVEDRELTKQNFEISSVATESDAVSFTPNSDLKIPYWHYMESDNKCEGTCAFASKRPPLREGQHSIESQLGRYIASELSSCLNDFQRLKEQGFEIEGLSGPTVNVKITQEDVVSILDYELEIKRGDATSEVDQFSARIPVNLQKIYNLATEITNMQRQYRFLERQNLNLIASFSSVDRDKLPPMSDMRFDFGSTISWSKQDVKNRIKQLLTSYIPLFRVDGTENFDREFYTSQLKQRIYDSMIIPVAEEKYSDLEATFNYLDFWPIYFDLNCDGQICRPESVSSSILSLIGFQRYSFSYDLSYPVLVEVFDEDALNGRGYKFNFFLESNIRNNEELKSDFDPLEAVERPTASYLCDFRNRNSAEVTVKAFDAVEGEKLADVEVTTTVNDESCYLGSTNSSGMLTTNFPTGTAGAVVTMMKPDYIAESQLFDAGGEESTLSAELEPIREKDVVVKKKLLRKIGKDWSFTNQVSDLNPEDRASITLTRVGPLTEEEFSTAAVVEGSQPDDLRIAPGNYELRIDMFTKDNLTIPKQKKKVKTGLFSEEEFEIPGISFSRDNPYPSGGVRMNVTITEEDFASNRITFFAVSPAFEQVPENKRTIEDLQEATKVDEYSSSYFTLLKPRFG